MGCSCTSALEQRIERLKQVPSTRASSPRVQGETRVPARIVVRGVNVVQEPGNGEGPEYSTTGLSVLSEGLAAYFPDRRIGASRGDVLFGRRRPEALEDAA